MLDQKKYWEDSAKFGPVASVIDPRDTLGFKNKYIIFVRDQAILSVLPKDKRLSILDFGCGSGNLTKALASDVRRVVGVDISFDLLRLAKEQNDPQVSSFLQFDGHSVPLKDQRFDLALTYVVLNHIVNDDHLIKVLKEIHRVLAPQGKLVCIEQTRKTGALTDNELKNQRSLDQFEKAFNQAGFRVEKREFIRRARFPFIFPIRWGWIDPKHFGLIAKWDKVYASIFNKPRCSYVDTFFVLSKDS